MSEPTEYRRMGRLRRIIHARRHRNVSCRQWHDCPVCRPLFQRLTEWAVDR